ncbi:tyrosine-type recombinase/integrase [Bifidobacterium cebidarum]|nr:tyrosine-type recombinase/integrase [Bifidobacterium cebidarum]
MKDTSLTASRGLATLTPSITVVNTHGTRKYRAYTCYRTASGDWRQITGSAPVPDIPEEENPAVHEMARSMAVAAMEKNMRRKLATGKTGTPRTHKLSEAIELFWKDKTKRNVRGNTRYTYEKQLAAVGKRLPDKSISAYSTAELQAVVDAIPEAAKVLKSIYYQAVREGWIRAADDPTRYLRIPAEPKVRKAQAKHTEDWISNAPGLLLWLAEPDITDPMTGETKPNRFHRFYALCLMEMGMGLRREEVLGLQWKDVDFDHRRVSVAERVIIEEKGRAIVKTSGGKTESAARLLPLSGRIADVLHAKRDAERGQPDDWVFRTGKGTHFKPAYLTSIWQELLLAYHNWAIRDDITRSKRTGKPRQWPDEKEMTKKQWSGAWYGPWKWRQHDNRHVAESIMEMYSVDWAVRKDILGHKKEADVTARYTHTTEQKRREAIELIDSELTPKEPEENYLTAEELQTIKEEPDYD